MYTRESSQCGWSLARCFRRLPVIILAFDTTRKYQGLKAKVGIAVSSRVVILVSLVCLVEQHALDDRYYFRWQSTGVLEYP